MPLKPASLWLNLVIWQCRRNPEYNSVRYLFTLLLAFIFGESSVVSGSDKLQPPDLTSADNFAIADVARYFAGSVIQMTSCVATPFVSREVCVLAGTSFWGIGNNRTTQGGVIAISGALFAATVGALLLALHKVRACFNLANDLQVAEALRLTGLTFMTPAADVSGELGSHGTHQGLMCAPSTHSVLCLLLAGLATW